jgi:hypothetical protein
LNIQSSKKQTNKTKQNKTKQEKRKEKKSPVYTENGHKFKVPKLHVSQPIESQSHYTIVPVSA